MKSIPEEQEREAADWNAERGTEQAVTKPFCDWLDKMRGNNGVGANEAWNAGVAYARASLSERQDSQALTVDQIDDIAAQHGDFRKIDWLFSNQALIQFARDIESACSQALPEQPTLRDRLQQQCSDWGAYWRASDSHGVELTKPQAVELLADALGVEVEIKDNGCVPCDGTGKIGDQTCPDCAAEPSDDAKAALRDALDRYLRQDETADDTDNGVYRQGLAAMSAASRKPQP